MFVILSFLPEHVCDTSASIISIVWQSTNAETIRLAIKYYSKDYINPQISFTDELDTTLEEEFTAYEIEGEDNNDKHKRR